MSRFHKIPFFFIYTEHKDSITNFFCADLVAESCFVLDIPNLGSGRETQDHFLGTFSDQSEKLFLVFNLWEQIL